jgi:hypothetical protein
MPRLGPVLLGAAILIAPVGVQAADLVVWWEKGYDDRENEAVREIIAPTRNRATHLMGTER